jgi:hypothetical protein
VPSDPARRRRLLALAGLAVLALLAGCSSAGSVELTAVDDDALAREASRPAPDPGDDGEVVREAVRNGSATATGTSPPVRVGDRRLPVRLDGAYHELSSDVVDETTVYRFEVGVDYNATDPEGPVVRAADLSARDRAVVADLFPPRTDRRREGYDSGTGASYTRAELAASALVDREQEPGSPSEFVLVRDGERYQLRSVRGEPDTRYTYRYTAERVAGSDDEYADRVRDRHLFVLRDLPKDEREVLAAATEGTYRADGSDDAAFRGVVERFRARGAVARDEYEGSWVVRWDGRTYWAEVRFGDY